jgi:RHS repeat-associated protein
MIGCVLAKGSLTPDETDQRYYASSYGRFNTADPYQASGGPASPASWNRYAYTRGDPVNRRDPRGLWDETDSLDAGPVGDGGGGGCGPVWGNAFGEGSLIPPDWCDPSMEQPTQPTPSCLDGLNPRDINYVSNNFIAAFTVGASNGDVLSAEFILAWAAHESAFGTSPAAKINNNYFGEKFLKCGRDGACVANTDPNRTAPWKGAIPCARVGAAARLVYACFPGSTLAESAQAALSSHNGRYLVVASIFQGAGVATVAQAIADAGWCTEGDCVNGGYGRAVRAAYNELVPVINCLFPWEHATLSP